MPHKTAPPTGPTQPPQADRLDSWKEIAAYLKRDERTVRRWEEEGLPVHRHVHKTRATIYAYKSQVDFWWNNGRPRLEQQERALAARSRWLPWLVAGMLTLAGGSAGLWLFFHVSSQAALPQMKVVPLTTLPGAEYGPALSPDGNQVAFLWDGGTPGASLDLYVKLIDAAAPLRLTNTPEDECCPTWSPEGRHIAFARSSKGANAIFTVSAQGGPERNLANLGTKEIGDLEWSPDGTSFAFSARSSPQEPRSIFVLSLHNLEARRLTSPPAQSSGDLRFAFSPDGATLALGRVGRAVDGIYLLTLGIGELRRLTFHPGFIYGLAWTADGRAIVFSADRGGSRGLWRIPATGGAPERLSISGESATSPTTSRRGNYLAYARSISDVNIWRVEVPKRAGRPKPPALLIGSTREDGAPQFSPDGKKIVFQSDRSGS